MLSVDPLKKDNIRMLRQFFNGESELRQSTVAKPAQRAMYLGEIARLRMMGHSEVALNHLERTMDAMGDEEWVHGSLVAALLNHDAGRHLTAVNAIKELATKHPRHPHVRAVVHQLSLEGKAKRLTSEPSKLHWLLENETDWTLSWPLHNVAVPPSLDSNELKQHAVKANAWVLLTTEEGVIKHASKKVHRSLPQALPLGLFTHLNGLIITIGGMPVDLGLPAGLKLTAAEKHGLLDR